jgi:glutamate-1-semialdehyde aminotransferase
MINTISNNKNYPKIEKSNEYYNRAIGLIPSFTQTLAKGPSQYVNGIAPKYLKKGKGAIVWDVDGNEYLDYNMAIGPLSLGYSYDKVDNAIKEQLQDGITFSLMHPLEVEVAELIREVIPNAESVRFSKSGADVTSAAIRLARAYTGKNKVLCCGYHGWHDWYIAVTSRNYGIPEAIKNYTFTFNYNDFDSFLTSIDDDIAAVILEPVVFNKPENNFLHKVAEVCKEKNIVLIFDEMWTGFRMAIGGAQEYFEIKPDLATYSKAVANGMPISILTGKREIMQLADEDVFFYTTFGGEALSLAAAKATINELKEKNVPSYLEHLGKELKEGLAAIIHDFELSYVKIVGYNWRTMVQFENYNEDSLLLKSYVQQEMIKRGILWSGFHNISFSHTKEQIHYTLDVYKEVLKMLKDAVNKNIVKELLLGEPVKPVFRKVDNFNMKPVR